MRLDLTNDLDLHQAAALRERKMKHDRRRRRRMPSRPGTKQEDVDRRPPGEWKRRVADRGRGTRRRPNAGRVRSPQETEEEEEPERFRTMRPRARTNGPCAASIARGAPRPDRTSSLRLLLRIQAQTANHRLIHDNRRGPPHACTVITALPRRTTLDRKHFPGRARLAGPAGHGRTARPMPTACARRKERRRPEALAWNTGNTGRAAARTGQRDSASRPFRFSWSRHSLPCA